MSRAFMCNLQQIFYHSSFTFRLVDVFNGAFTYLMVLTLGICRRESVFPGKSKSFNVLAERTKSKSKSHLQSGVKTTAGLIPDKPLTVHSLPVFGFSLFDSLSISLILLKHSFRVNRNQHFLI